MATVKALMLATWMPLSQWRSVWARKYHLWECAGRLDGLNVREDDEAS